MSDVRIGPRARLARIVLVDLAIMTVIGVVLALIGPFATSAMPLSQRLFLWLAYVYVGYLAYRPVWPLSEAVSRRLHLPLIGVLVAGCLLATVPATMAILAIEAMPGAFPALTVESALGAYLNVLVIGASIMVIFYLIERNRAATVPPSEPDPEPVASQPVEREEQPRFLERLPPELGTELIALEMEDHYVRAHTMLGSDLVLMRLGDAMAELEALEGMQVHRSWWVARGAVEDVVRDGRNIRLVLPRGLQAPVSRANVQKLKDEGWL